MRVKRVYDPAEPADGLRILVDRLWPRGLTKERAAVDVWLKDVAPSAALRRWFGHDPERWPEFARRYRAELRRHPEPLRELRAMVKGTPVTLLFAARDVRHNQAVLLERMLRRR